MKTLILFGAICFFSISSAKGQIVTIPDANFKAYLVGNALINTNADSEIQLSEAAAFTGNINCPSQGIADLTGIEAFTSLTKLYCYNNGAISSINVSNIPTLQHLFCSSNNVTSLDLSANPNLTFLACDDNELTSLNIANGNNTILANVYANNNSGLSCIQVDDVSYSTTTWTGSNYVFDAGASFSTNCSACIVTIPDAAFKAYLVGNASINTNSDSEIQCSEASAFTGDIYCPNLNITDLTGIEAFTSLTGLYCNGNQLTTLNTSANTDLIMLYTQNNLLTSLNLSGNTALTDLNCTVNNLSTLDLTSLTALEWLDCSVNQLTSLNLSMNPLMDQLFCYSNNLTSLDLSNNTILYDLSCAVNQITSLDLSNNSALLSINCAGNQLQQLDLSSCTAMTTVSCQLNQLTSLDLSGNPALIALQCQNNALTVLNIANGQNDNLIVLFSQANPDLTCIQVDDAAYSNTNWVSGNYIWDAASSFNEDCGLGIKEDKSILGLYPNPVNDLLYVDLSENTTVQIVNLMGEIVQLYTLTEGTNSLAIENLHAGIYFLQTQNGSKTMFVKL